MKLISIGKAAKLLGVSITTMRRWGKEGKLLEVTRTFGRPRRYVEEELLNLIYPEQEERINVGYARVSTHDQKKDLENQAEVLEGVCKKEKKSYIKIY